MYSFSGANNYFVENNDWTQMQREMVNRESFACEIFRFPFSSTPIQIQP